MGFSAVHKVRAAACKALEEAILAPYEKRAKTLEIPGLDKCTHAIPEHYRDEPQICATVTSLEAVEAARAEGATRLYMTTDVLEAVGLSPADAFEQGIVPVLDEVCRAVDHERVDPWINAGATVAVGNISELAVAAQTGATAEIRSCLPVHNTPCMEALAERGAGAFWLSPEITLDEIVRRARGSGHHRLWPPARYDKRALHSAGCQRLHPRLCQLPPACPQAVTQEYRRKGHARPHRHPRPLSPVRRLPHRPHASGSSAARCRRASSHGGRNAARDG